MCLYEIYLQNSEFTNTVSVPKQRASRLILSFITGRGSPRRPRASRTPPAASAAGKVQEGMRPARNISLSTLENPKEEV